MSNKALEKLFNELESGAYDVTWHKYYFKEANQIIRKHFEALFEVSNEDIDKMFPLKEYLGESGEQSEQAVIWYNQLQGARREGAKQLMQKHFK